MARTRTRIVDNNDQKAAARRASNNNNHAAEVDSQAVVRKDRPTPSMRDTKPKRSGAAGLIYRIPVIGGIAGYFRGVASEMQKVTWPSREETTHLTTVVLAVTIAFAIGLGVLDGFFAWWFRQAFHADSEWLFLVIAGVVTVAASGGYFAFRHRI